MGRSAYDEISEGHNRLMDNLQAQWDARYRRGETPWDSGITPPEVVSFFEEQGPAQNGLALDLGCGTGTNVLWLARHGLHVIGVELAGNGLVKARYRLSVVEALVRRRIHLHPEVGLGNPE